MRFDDRTLSVNPSIIFIKAPCYTVVKRAKVLELFFSLGNSLRLVFFCWPFVMTRITRRLRAVVGASLPRVLFHGGVAAPGHCSFFVTRVCLLAAEWWWQPRRGQCQQHCRPDATTRTRAVSVLRDGRHRTASSGAKSPCGCVWPAAVGCASSLIPSKRIYDGGTASAGVAIRSLACLIMREG